MKLLFLSASDYPSPYLFLAIFLPLCIALWLLPGFIAHRRHLRNETAVWLITIFLGWTFIGWLIALIWASIYEKPVEVQNQRLL